MPFGTIFSDVLARYSLRTSCDRLQVHTHTHAHTVPSFKEGYHVNLTAVKYHGGRNYKMGCRIVEYDRRNIQPQILAHPRTNLLFQPHLLRSRAGAEGSACGYRGRPRRACGRLASAQTLATRHPPGHAPAARLFHPNDRCATPPISRAAPYDTAGFRAARPLTRSRSVPSPPSSGAACPKDTAGRA